MLLGSHELRRFYGVPCGACRQAHCSDLWSAAKVPLAAKEAFLTSRMLALRKGDGKLRPIGAPSVLRNLAERVACAHSRGELAKAVGPRQYGVGRKAGLKEAIHTARALAELRPQTVRVALDATNAFNAFWRHRVL